MSRPRSSRSFRRLALPIPILLAAALPLAAEAFTPTELADGVWLFSPQSTGELGLERHNALVVRQSRGLVVVGAQPTPEAARLLLDSIAASLDTPVRFLVLPHPTVASIGGASAFPDDVETIGRQGFEGQLGDPSLAEMRWRGVEATTPLATPPVTYTGNLVLADADRTVVVDGIVPGYAPRASVVRVPEAGLVFADALVFPAGTTPFADRADLRAWLAALNAIVSERPQRIVGRTGPAFGLQDVIRMRDALAWLRGQVNFAFMERVKLADMRDRVLAAEDLGRHFETDRYAGPLTQLIDLAVEEAADNRRKQGFTVE